MQISLYIAGFKKIQLYGLESYTLIFKSGAEGEQYVKSHLENSVKVYELLTYEEIGSSAIKLLNEILIQIPESFKYIIKAAERTAFAKSSLIYSDLVELFNSTLIPLKLQVMDFINNLLRSTPDDKASCKLMAQLETLNFYEYLRKATEFRCVELDEGITNFQKLTKKLISGTQYENEALRNLIQELTIQIEKLQGKIVGFAEQQNLFEYLKQNLRNYNNAARMSIERSTLYTPCINLNKNSHTYKYSYHRKTEIVV